LALEELKFFKAWKLIRRMYDTRGSTFAGGYSNFSLKNPKNRGAYNQFRFRLFPKTYNYFISCFRPCFA